jgi:autotransporter-associated beta strand protein
MLQLLKQRALCLGAVGGLSILTGTAGAAAQPPPVIEMDGGTLEWANGYNEDLSASLVLNDGKLATFNTGTNVVVLSRPLALGTSGTAALAKIGSGTLVLAGTNGYTGPTTVREGTLLVNGALASASAVTVASGATLGGNGMVGGPVLVQPGGTLTPRGDFPATLAARNTLNVLGNLSFRLNKGPGSAVSSDLISGVSTATLGGTLSASLNAGSSALTGTETFLLLQAARYDGDIPDAVALPALQPGLNWWLGSFLAGGSIKVNCAPVGVDYTLEVRENGTATVAATELLANDRDRDGDALSITGLGAASHGNASLNAGMVFYTPAPDYTGADSFTYLLSDGHGGAATGNVNVTVTPGSGAAIEVVYGPAIINGNFVVRFAGTPGSTYAIESTEGLSPANWQTETNVTAPMTPGAYGVGVFEFSESTRGVAARYYRVLYPASQINYPTATDN